MANFSGTPVFGVHARQKHLYYSTVHNAANAITIIPCPPNTKPGERNFIYMYFDLGNRHFVTQVSLVTMYPDKRGLAVYVGLLSGGRVNIVL